MFSGPARDDHMSELIFNEMNCVAMKCRHRLPDGVPHLVVYTAFFYFGTSFFVISTSVLSLSCALKNNV